MTAAAETCPTCRKPVKPSDFMCPRCELILHPALAPEKPNHDISVVRRMLEAPRAEIPGTLAPKPPKLARSSAHRSTGRTKVMTLPPELDGTPRVVAGLASLDSFKLTEFEAWLVSLVDGRSTAAQLAQRANLKDIELRIVVQTLRSRGVLDLVPTAKAAPPTKPAPARPTLAPVPLGETIASTDPRIRYTSKNQKRIVDALKNVKRSPTGLTTTADALADAPGSDADIQVALRMEQGGRNDEAIRFLEKALEARPNAGPLYNRLAVVLVRERADFARAERLLQRAIELA
ncbi:MAG: hypothetical protein JNG84_07720, partial [Archangium sp.]|nr:hypothetical protein [Archangium sp.]